ncbi:MAG: hypothetical protein ACJ0DG_10190, partial [bacterium]
NFRRVNTGKDIALNILKGNFILVVKRTAMNKLISGYISYVAALVYFYEPNFLIIDCLVSIY